MLTPLALIGIVIVSCLMSVGILGSLLRTGVPGIGRWCTAYALFTAASSWLLLAGDRPGQIVIISVSLTTLVAVQLLVQGTRQFFGQGAMRHGESAAFALIFGALAYFTCVSPNIDARVELVSIFMAYGRIAVGTLALRHTPRDGARYAYRFVVAAAYLGALVHVARAAAIGFGIAPQLPLLQMSPWNSLLFGLMIVTLPCMSIGMVMLAHDQLIRKMEKLSTIDELTGALMRRAFTAKANVLLCEAQAKGNPLSIVILDIDNFKLINDSFGHAVGDRVLAHVASVVSGRLRSCDVFGRLGGEEFAILFADTSKTDAASLTNALRLAVERSPSGGVRCTFSAGVECVTQGDTLAGAMARADAALYMAKSRGRNRIVTAPETDERDALNAAELG